MSNNLIDNIFDYNSYRYVPEELKVEWKNLYNLYRGEYYKKQHEIYNIYPQTRIDLYNEELDKLKHIENLYINFNCISNNIQPKYNSDIEYSERVKQSLKKSVEKMNTFVQIKKSIVLNKINEKDVPIRENVENFEQCNDMEQVSNNKIPIIITLLIVLILFFLSLHYDK